MGRDGHGRVQHGEGGGRWSGIDRQLAATILTMFVRPRLTTLIAKINRTGLDTLRALIETGAITPAIDRIIALEGLPDAIRDLSAGRVRGKIVIAT